METISEVGVSGPPPKGSVSAPFLLCASVLLLALLTGGGTHSGFLGDVVSEVLAIVLLMTALWPAFDPEGVRKERARVALWVCGVCVALVFIQLLPLPFDVWSGRKLLMPDGDETRFGGVAPGWSTLSLTPQATWSAALSLLVPLAIFSAVVQLEFRQRIMLCWLVLAVGAASLLLSLLQVAQGEASPLRFYSFTNPTEAVGFFANRNHFAAFLNITLVLSGLWLAQTIETTQHQRGLQTASVLWFAAAFAFFVSIVAGLAMARSRAGVVLAIFVLTGVVVMIARQGRHPREPQGQKAKSKTSRVSVIVAVFAVLFALQAGLGRLLVRFEADPAEDLRWVLNATTFKTAVEALPFGTGLGSFVPVYAIVERPRDAVPGFVNRAHDDLAELFLETGLPGIALLTVFLLWFGRKMIAIWSRFRPETPPQNALLNCASSLIVLSLLLHSLVDYPLRTTALGALFALFCAILAVPANAASSDEPKPAHRPRRTKIDAAPAPVPCNDLVWPEGWTQSAAAKSSSEPLPLRHTYHRNCI